MSEKSYFPIYAKAKIQISCMIIMQLICIVVFATFIVQHPYFPNLTFGKDSSHYLWHGPQVGNIEGRLFYAAGRIQSDRACFELTFEISVLLLY